MDGWSAEIAPSLRTQIPPTGTQTVITVDNWQTTATPHEDMNHTAFEFIIKIK